MLTISYSLIWKQAAGSRNDLRLKRKFYIAPPADEHVSSSNCEMVARVDVLYSANLAPPSWVHVYRAVTCTSVRTQAASIAYMFPHHINMMTQWTALRILNARTRCLKYETCLQNITVPPHFISNSTMCVGDCDGGVVVVCDGGIDHNVTKKPPPNKVSVIISFILPHICLIFILLSWLYYHIRPK